MDVILFNLLFIVQVLCKSFTNGLSTADKPFWINPCGYITDNDINNDDLNDNDIHSEENFQDTINKLIILAKQCQYNIDSFKTNYITSTFNTDFSKHYQTWKQKNNSWMTSRLLKNAEEVLSENWLAQLSFPRALKYTYEMLQQVSVGFEILLQDASTPNSAESKFSNNFSICKNNIQAILCEVSDAIDTTLKFRPSDITRDIVPIEVRQETSSSERNLTNSIIFRDYVIVTKYILSIYKYLLSSYKLFYL